MHESNVKSALRFSYARDKSSLITPDLPATQSILVKRSVSADLKYARGTDIHICPSRGYILLGPLFYACGG